MPPVTGSGCVAGRYELLGQIGRGAMGTVWRARDLVLAREVAIKQVHLPELMTSQERSVLRQRTLREARVSARLHHPGIVTVYDVIESGGAPWIVMELIEARSLDQVLAQDGPLPPRQVAATGALLLRALASAHAAGIVHRDVKPANVLITPSGRVVLTDFGIATLDGDPGLTQTGMVMGTPGFCAPERIRGEPASPASDLWSLGATLYAAVEGHGPFDGEGAPLAVMASIVHTEPPPARCGGPLAAVIAALLDRDPTGRPDAAQAARLLSDAACDPSTTQHGTIQHGTIQHGTIQHGTIQHGSAAQHGPVAGFATSYPASGTATSGITAAPAGRRADRSRQGGRPRWGGESGRRRLFSYSIGGIAVVLAGLTAGTVIGRANGHAGSGAPSASPSPHGTAAAGSLPAGYRWYIQPAGSAGVMAGFAVAVPAGWQVRQEAAATYLQDPASAASISISAAPLATGGPVREAQALERAALSHRRYSGYRRIAIGSFVFRSHLAGAWRFSYRRQPAELMDALDVIIQLPARRGPARYQLLASAPAAKWQATRSVLAQVLRTLRPVS